MDKLYHYTDANGLLGILKNKCIWLTNIQFLNDSSEYEDGRKFILEATKKRLEEIDSDELQELLDFPAIEFTKGLVGMYLAHIENALLGSNHPRYKIQSYLFVFSLSEKQDLLSQWRGYCPNGGFSLEINVEKLHQHLANIGVPIDLVPCIYEGSDKNKHALEAVDKGISSFAELMTGRSEKEAKEASKDVFENQFFDMKLMAARFKHHAFEEESEARLLTNASYPADWLRHRVSNGVAIPYLECPIDINIIEKIMISPTTSLEGEESVRAFLSNNPEFENIEITKSDIPLV